MIRRRTAVLAASLFTSVAACRDFHRETADALTQQGGAGGTGAGGGGGPASRKGSLAGSSGQSGSAGVSAAGRAPDATGGSHPSGGSFNATGGVAGYEMGPDAASGSAGSPSGGSEAVAGASGTGAAAVNPDIDEIITPACHTETGNFGAFPLTRATDLAAEMVTQSDPAIMVTQQYPPVVLTRWQMSYRGDWTPWGCYDVVPYPDRIANALNPDLRTDAFVTTSQGKLFMRQWLKDSQGKDFLGPWIELTPPRYRSELTDVAAVAAPAPRESVYVISDGEVFVRSRLDADREADLGPWASLGLSNALRLGVQVLDSTGLHRVVVADRNGVLWQTRGNPRDGVDDFEPWQVVDAPEGIVSIDIATSVDSPSVLFVADSEARAWACPGADSCEWALLNGDDTDPSVSVVSALSQPMNDPPWLFAVSTAGEVYMAESPWTEWVALP